MYIQHHTLQNIPVVIIWKQQLESSVNKGCILCYHGLTSSKDDWIHDLKLIAKRGFLVVGVDNVGHGERKDLNFDSRFSQNNPNFWQNFVAAIQATASELPLLIDELVKRGFALEHKVGALGVSMGGLIIYSAILVEPRLSTAVTIVSSPEWWGLEHRDSPHHHPKKFSEIKLLSVTGGQDTIVPNKYTILFHEKLRVHFSDYSSRLKHKIYPASDHMMNPDWDDAWNTALMWFENYL